MRSYRATIYGECQSKANSRRIVFHGGVPRVIKSKKAMVFATDISKQILRKPFLEGSLHADIKIYYKDRRPDLDPSLILDGLQDRWYKNDRQIMKITCERYLDKALPRCEVTVSELNWDEHDPKRNQ
tara:strand:- start:20373 stop:20753 length:381 start_codon:yes stop_codon:yes gene_type:complete